MKHVALQRVSPVITTTVLTQLALGLRGLLFLLRSHELSLALLISLLFHLAIAVLAL